MHIIRLSRRALNGSPGSLHLVGLLFGLVLGVLPISLVAQTTYTWNGSAGSAWNVPANWTPGTGFPTATDHAIIVAAANAPVLDMSRNVVNLTVNGGSLNLNGFTLTSTGNGALNGGAVNNGTFAPNTTGTMNFAGTVFGAAVNGTTGVLQFAGSTFNGAVNLTKTGSGNDYSSANTVFNGTATFTVTAGRLYLANTGTTQFNGNVVVNSTGTSGGVWMGQNTGTLTLAAGRTISAGTFTAGSLLFRNFTQVGSTPQNIALTLGANLYFQTGSVFSGAVTGTAPGLYLNGTTFNATARFTKTGATNEYSSGSNVYQSTAEFTTTGPGNLFLANVGADQYNGDIVVNSSGAGGILFGNSTGTSTLAPGRTITVGSIGYASSIFQLGGFIQSGPTPQTMTFGSGTVVRMRAGSSFGGALTLTARGFQIAGSTFAGNCVFTKIGASDETSTGGNVFQGSLELINTTTGSLYFADNTPDTYNGDVRLSCTSTGQIRFGNSGTGGGTLAAGRTMSIGTLGFDAGLLLLSGIVQLGPTPQNLTLGTSALLYFRSGNIFNGELTAAAGRLFLDGSTFNAASRFTKSGGGGDGSQGGNVYNGPVEFSNTSTGNFSIAFNGVDAFNGDVTVSSTSTGEVRFGQNSGSVTLAAGRTISVGSLGFDSGQLLLRNFLQVGSTPQSLVLGTGASLHFQTGSVFNGAVSATSGGLFLSGATFNAPGRFTKTGASGDGSQGGNVFNGVVDLINTGTGNFSVNFSGTDQFNENVRVSSTSTGDIRFGQNGGTSTLADGRTLTVGTLGFDSGRLLIGGMTQVGVTPQTLVMGSSAILFFQPGSTFNGDVSTTSGGLFFNGTTFNARGTFVKTGSSGDGSSGGNVFNGFTEITNTGSGNLSICSTGIDQFNADLRLNNTSSGDIRFGQGGGSTTLAAGRTIAVGALGFETGQLVIRNFTQLGGNAQELLLGTNASLHLQSGNLFTGDILTTSGRLYLSGTTFNGTGHFSKTNAGGDASLGGNTFHGNTEFVNSGTGNLSLNFTGFDSFNGDVRLNNTSTGEIRFGQNGGGSTLADGRTIAVGSLGFNAGTLAIGNMVQLGGTAQTLTLGSSALLYFQAGTVFNGAVTSISGGLFFNGTTFNSTGRFTKTGPSGDGSQGGNVFNGTTEFSNTSTGNLSINFTGVDLFNADVRVNNTSTGEIRFGQNGGSSTLAAGQTITVGGLGFATGRLMFQNFLQVGATPQVLLLGSGATLFYQTGSVFNGTVTSTSGGLFFNGTTFNSAGRFTKTGPSGDGSLGGNTFNGVSEFTITSTGNLSLNFTGVDLFNADVRVNSTSTGEIRFGQNGGSSTLAAGRTITVGGLGFATGRLMLQNLLQVGATPQVLTLGSGASLFYQSGTVFNGTVTSTSGGLFFNGTTFNDQGRFSKTGTSNDDSSGGNTFNGPAEFIKTGSGDLNLHQAGMDAFNGDVVVNCTSTGDISFGRNGGSSTLASGRTIAVGGLGFNTGRLLLRNFNQVGGTAQALNLGTSATLIYQTGTVFNGNITSTSGGLFFNGSTFNGSGRFTKTGPTGDGSTGGNTFNGTTEFILTSVGNLSLDWSGVDQFNADMLVNCTSTGQLQFGQNGGSASLASGRTISVGALGFNTGQLIFRNFTQLGGTAQALTLGAGATCNFQSGTTFNGDLIVSAGNLGLNGATFNGVNWFRKTGSAANNCSGNNLFVGNTELVNTGAGGWNMANTGVDTYQNGLLLNSTNTGGIQFGASGGITSLASGTFSVGATGFSAGTITFRNFTKVGTLAASLLGTVNSSVTFLTGNTFNGDLSVTTGNLLFNGSVFNGNGVFNKTGTANNSSAGGNTFNGSVEINTAGQMSLASNAADDFNGNATFRRLGAGTFVVGNNFNTSFSFNVSTVGSTGGPVQFGNGSGRTIFDGTTLQTFQGDAAAPPNVRNMTLAMTGAGELQLLSNVNVQVDIAFTSGVVKPMATTSTSNGLLILAHGSTVSDPADAGSHVDGFVRKVGNTAFTFPVGSGGVVAPIRMSAPGTNTHHFTARYLATSSHPTYPHTSKDVTLDHLSQCEYWILDRTNSTTNVSVTLSWDTPRSCGVTDLSQLAVARWNGSQWRDHGGTAIGTLTTGTITSAAPISLFASPSLFTLASTGLGNPLPIELISFTAIDEGTVVRTDWSTAVEVDNDHFEVERSQDGVVFETIGTVDGAGNSQSTQHYTFLDEQPLSGASYYRLKQVDTDGTFTYGPVVAVVRSNAIADLSIWPNPVEREMHFTAAGEVDAIRLHDAAGRLIEAQQVSASSGVITLDLDGVPTGVLILTVTMKDGSARQQRILKR